jgi:DNA-binding HxlR family transcriptional regulator
MHTVEMIQHLLNGKYKLGDPWKLPKGAGFVLPLLVDPPFIKRDYVLLQEVENQVDFKDSGGISGVDALNTSGKNVFIRKGTMFSGKGTQSRSPVAGVVLLPGKEFVRISVNCIHQSHYISSGAKFKAEGVAPHSVYQALGEQSETWESVSGYARKMRGNISRMMGESAPSHSMEALDVIREDNLVGVSRAVEEIKDEIEDALSSIPGDHVNQVGIAVFNLDGIVGVELYDHPDSWRAFSDSIIRSYSEVLLEEVGELYEIRMDRAGTVLKSFLEKVKTSERTLLTENEVSKIWALKAEGVDGELAEVEGKEIHLVLAKVDKERGMGNGPRAVMNFEEARNEIQEPEASQVQRTEEQRYDSFLSKRGGYNLLQTLSDRAQRFGELLGSVKASRGTLATRLKEGADIGLIQKAIRQENGSPAYALTEEGKKVKKEGDSKVV